jgi:hypothetical protein
MVVNGCLKMIQNVGFAPMFGHQRMVKRRCFFLTMEWNGGEMVRRGSPKKKHQKSWNLRHILPEPVVVLG